MTSDDANLFGQWRAADRDAHAVEQAVTRASLDALEGRGVPPSSEELAKAQELRQTADRLFKLAMKEMGARVSRLRH